MRARPPAARVNTLFVCGCPGRSGVGTPGRFFYFFLVSIDLIKHKTVDVNANPYSNPEINLFLLLDSYLVKYCTVPSIASGNIKIEMLR